MGIYALFLLKMGVEGVYFKNLNGATLAPLNNFVIDVIGPAPSFTYLLIMTNLICGINIIMFGIKLKLMKYIMQILELKDIKNKYRSFKGHLTL